MGVLPQPAQGRRAVVEDRDVSVVRAQLQFGRGDPVREPRAVGAGHDPVPAAVDEAGRSDDRGGVEAPRADAGEVASTKGPCHRKGGASKTPTNQDHSPTRAASSSSMRSGSRGLRQGSRVLRARPAAARSPAASPMPNPANQSRPSAPNGAKPATLTTRRTRSGSRAAHARACEPPPEWPMTANRSMPKASATAET